MMGLNPQMYVAATTSLVVAFTPLDYIADHLSLFQHQPGDHPRYDASLKKDPFRRPPSPYGRPRSLRRFEPPYRRHVPLPAAENQPKERYINGPPCVKPYNASPNNRSTRPHNPQIRRTRPHGLRRRTQTNHHHHPRLRYYAAARPLEIPAHGRRHDGIHASLPALHQPPPHPEHHPAQRRL